jgi:hypothetical protein
LPRDRLDVGVVSDPDGRIQPVLAHVADHDSVVVAADLEPGLPILDKNTASLAVRSV